MLMIRFSLWLLLCVWLYSQSTVAVAAVYRCTGDDGVPVFTDRACAAGAEPASLPPIGIVPAGEEMDLASMYDERVARQVAAHRADVANANREQAASQAQRRERAAAPAHREPRSAKMKKPHESAQPKAASRHHARGRPGRREAP